MNDAQKQIISLLTDDVTTYDDAIWTENALYAANLIETDFPTEKMKNYQLHACIAYAAHYLYGAEVEDAQSAKSADDMADTFWWCVMQLAMNKLKESPQVSLSEFALIGCSNCGATGQELISSLCPECFAKGVKP